MKTTLAIFILFSSTLNIFGQTSDIIQHPKSPLELKSATPTFIYNYISSISLGWKSSRAKTKKSESKKQVLIHDKTGKNIELIFDAIKDINDTFGYEKLEPQISTTSQAKEGTIVVFVGPETEGRVFLRNLGDKKFTRGPWDGLFWSDSEREMSRAAIALHSNLNTNHSLKYYARRSLLTALGYPGSTVNMNGIFDGYSKPTPNTSPSENFISDWDIAILRFCDRSLSSDENRSNMKKVILNEWPTFAAQQQKIIDDKKTNN